MKLPATLAVAVLFPVFFCVAQEKTSTTLPAEALFNRGMNALEGSPKRDRIRALDDIRAAAESGYIPAQTVIAYFSSSSGEAARWYRKAAEAGDTLAQFALGNLYLSGSLSGDREDARRWLTLAASGGEPHAAYLLGTIAEDRDYKLAPDLYRQAAAKGIPYAQYRLGWMLKNGRGVTADLREAYLWLSVSREAGVDRAGAELRDIESRVTTEQAEEFQTAARELATRVTRSVQAHGCQWDGELDVAPTLPPPQVQKFCR